MFKRCIRKLLESTFILRDKDDKLYQFASRESNRQDISDYLRMIGFDVIRGGEDGSVHAGCQRRGCGYGRLEDGPM